MLHVAENVLAIVVQSILCSLDIEGLKRNSVMVTKDSFYTSCIFPDLKCVRELKSRGMNYVHYHKVI